MSSGTIFWILLLVVGPLLMVLMHRGHRGHGGHGGAAGHGSHGGGPAGPATAPADPRTKADEDSSSHAGHRAGQGASEQDAGGHRHRGC